MTMCWQSRPSPAPHLPIRRAFSGFPVMEGTFQAFSLAVAWACHPW